MKDPSAANFHQTWRIQLGRRHINTTILHGAQDLRGSWEGAEILWFSSELNNNSYKPPIAQQKWRVYTWLLVT